MSNQQIESEQFEIGLSPAITTKSRPKINRLCPITQKLTNRSANDTVFGYDFQINAAIVLVIRNLPNLEYVKVESHLEDIDILLDDGTHIVAQVKAFVEPDKARHAIQKLEKAIETLSEASNKAEIKRYIYVTNTYYPFGKKLSERVFRDLLEVSHAALSTEVRDKISDLIKKNNCSFDENKFIVQVLPFTNDDEERRIAYVKREMIESLSNFFPVSNLPIARIHGTWKSMLYTDASKRSVELEKKQLVWPLIAIGLETQVNSEEYFEMFDEPTYSEAENLYSSSLTYACERFELVTKILAGYKEYSQMSNVNHKLKSFIENNWQSYKEDFEIEGIAPEIQECLVRMLIYKVVMRRFIIDKIKKGVKL